MVRHENLTRDATLVVIASEDRYAVQQYFEFFHSTRIQFKVLETDDGRSSPTHVMDRLSQFMKEYDLGEGDQFWLVCDTDHWTEAGHIKNLKQVVAHCRKKGVQVAISNPCFDLWLLLHFADFPVTSPLTCKDVQRQLRQVIGQYNKTRVFALPIDDNGVQNAIDRSKAHSSSVGIPQTTSTAVHLIIEDLVARQIISIASSN